MTKASDPRWFYRVDGAVVGEAADGGDPTRFLAENALAKTPRGEVLTDAEEEALEVLRTAPASDIPEMRGADARLGLVALRRREVLEALDEFAEELAKDCLGQELTAWQVLGDYCDRAAGAVRVETGEWGGPGPDDEVPHEGWSQEPPVAL